MAPVELRMDVHCYKCAKKIRKSVENLRGVRKVSASPEKGLVVVYGTADPYALRRLLDRKMERPVKIVSDGSAPYYYQHDTTAAPPYFGPSQQHGYGWGAPVAPHDYYPQPPPPPPPAYYPQPPPPPPPAGPYPYAAGGYGAGWVDPDPYGYRYRYRQRSPGSFCSIM